MEEQNTVRRRHPQAASSPKGGERSSSRPAAKGRQYHAVLLIRIAQVVGTVVFIAIMAVLGYLFKEHAGSGAIGSTRESKKRWLEDIDAAPTSIKAGAEVRDGYAGVELEQLPKPSGSADGLISASGLAAMLGTGHAAATVANPLDCKPPSPLSMEFIDAVVVAIQRWGIQDPSKALSDAPPLVVITNAQLPAFIDEALPEVYRRHPPKTSRFRLVTLSCAGEGPLHAAAEHYGSVNVKGRDKRPSSGIDKLEQLMHCPYLASWYAAGFDLTHTTLSDDGLVQPLPAGISSELLHGTSDAAKANRGSLLSSVGAQQKAASTSYYASLERRQIVAYWPYPCGVVEAAKASLPKNYHASHADYIQTRLCAHLRSAEGVRLATASEIANPTERYKAMASVRFVITPPVTIETQSFDSPMLWEAMALGAAPVVQRTPASERLLAGSRAVLVEGFVLGGSGDGASGIDSWAAAVKHWAVQEIEAGYAAELRSRELVSERFWGTRLTDGR